MIERIRKYIINNKTDLKYIIILLIILLVISIPKLLSQYHTGIGNWDTCLYLENARVFSRMGWGDVPSIAPVLPMILSKLFLIAKHPYTEAIFNVDVVFYIVGSIGFYLLLRQRFNHLNSFIASIIYATFTLLYSWVAIGGNDIIGTTGTILTIYLVIVAHKYDNRLYYLAMPIAAYAFLSRYTAGVMIFAIIYYFLINRIDTKELKHIVIGGVLGVISISWFLNQFYKTLGTPVPFLSQFSGTVNNTAVMDSGFLPNPYYYIEHLPNYLSSTIPTGKTFNAVVNPMGNIPTLLSYIYLVLIIAGLILIIFRIYTAIKGGKAGLRSNRSTTYMIVAIISFILSLVTVNSMSYIVTVILFIIFMLALYFVLEDLDIECLDYDFLMIVLFVSYLVFQSILFTKNDRYFITVLPFLAFFICYAIKYIYELLDELTTPKLKYCVSIALVVLLVFNSLTFVANIPDENEFDDIEDACRWLADNEDELNNQTIVYSDNWPAVSWYMNIFCQRGVPNTNNSTSILAFSEEVLTHNKTHQATSYYIDTHTTLKADYPGLTKIQSFNNTVIYKNSYLLDGHNMTDLEEIEYTYYLDKTLDDYNKSYT